MKIKGYLSTIRPIHITSSTTSNTTGIATEGVLDRRKGYVMQVPVVPGTVLRGKLRRAASDRVTDALKAEGIQIPIEVYNALRHGSNSGRQTNDPLRASFYMAQREHPLMGIMGGGPRQGSGGALIVASIYPFCHETASVHMVPWFEDAENAPYASNLINEQTMFPGLDIIKNHDESARDTIEQFDEKVDEILFADVQRRVKKDAAENDAPTSTLRGSNLLVFRSMIAGALLYFNVGLDERASDVQKGFLILCIQDVLNNNMIGGMSRVGIGTDVFDLAFAAGSLKNGDESIFDFDEDTEKLIIAENTQAAEYVSAFHAWEDGGKAWTADSLWHATGFEGIDLTQAAVKKTTAKAAPKAKKAA